MLEEDVTTIAKRFDLVAPPFNKWDNSPKKDDVTPGRHIPVIYDFGGGRGLDIGFPHWGWWFYKKNVQGKTVKSPLIINSRADTILANLDNPKKFYQESLSSKRCIIPANAFFEWVDRLDIKWKYKFSHPTEKIMSLAGYRVPVQELDGSYSSNVVIITTEPTEQMRFTGHDRMPLILSREGEHKWLERNNGGRDFLTEFFDNNNQELLIKDVTA